jgi:hypothetical protein
MQGHRSLDSSPSSWLARCRAVVLSFGMQRTCRHAITALLALLAAIPAHADVELRNFKFGILKEVSPNKYRMDRETFQLPRKYKETGFRFGLEFENPNLEAIEWFEVVHLPSPLQEATGNTKKVAPRAIQTDRYTSSDFRVVDHFWFDRGDPLGKHQMNVYVNGKQRFTVNFEVIEDDAKR